MQGFSSASPVIAFGLADKAILPPAQLLASAHVFAPPASATASHSSQMMFHDSTQGSEGQQHLSPGSGVAAHTVSAEASPSPGTSKGSVQEACPARPAKWAERLCHTTFFGPCPHHSSKMYRRCEVSSIAPTRRSSRHKSSRPFHTNARGCDLTNQTLRTLS